MGKMRRMQSCEPIEAHIEKFSHDGRGIARIEGKTTFIEGALPNETVLFQYTRKKRDFDEGTVVSVVVPSVDRVAPQCPHFSVCGGCSLQHLSAEAQVYEKQALLKELLERMGHTAPDVWLSPLTSDPWHYRNKARLSVRRVEKKALTLIGFREKNHPRYIADLHQCLVLNKAVDAEMMRLRTLLNTMDDQSSIAQIEVAAGDDAIALIVRHLSAFSPADLDRIKQFGQDSGFRIFLQPGGIDSVHLFFPNDGNDYLNYQLPNEGISFRFHPTDFTQVNAAMNQRMVNQALQLLALEPNDKVLDLYCGLGNFSLPIAKHCQAVLGIEGSERMVHRAQMNAEHNAIRNAEFKCLDLDSATALAAVGPFHCSKVLLDPPRTGALAIVNQMDALDPHRIVYVSCNPVTLARDANVLVTRHAYRLAAAGVMDMFPHTAHVESIAVFEKR